MSRSGYSDDLDNWAMIKWRGRVTSATRGKRGQKLLRDLLAALDAMPEKRLVSSEFQADGEFCALGVVANARGIDTSDIDVEDSECGDAIADRLDIAAPLAKEIMFFNDEWIDKHEFIDIEICGPMRPHFPDWDRHKRTVRVAAKNMSERRWQYMREWVAKQIKASQ